MRLKIRLSGLKKPKAWEYLVRYLFGGTITVVTGIVAEKYGPAVGGLLLAFPAILPASLTLIKEHDGLSKAVDDARGARLGSLALAAFGVVVWFVAEAWPGAAVLSTALGVWILVGAGAWWVQYGAHRSE